MCKAFLSAGYFSKEAAAHAFSSIQQFLQKSVRPDSVMSIAKISEATDPCSVTFLATAVVGNHVSLIWPAVHTRLVGVVVSVPSLLQSMNYESNTNSHDVVVASE
jgi:hypothetical protein